MTLNKRLLQSALLLGCAVIGVLIAVPVLADTGPKPSAAFEFHFDGAPIPIADGALILCDNEDCSRSHPLEEVGPQQFTCSATRCWSDAYGYGERLKLIIDFEDRTRASNVFRKEAFNARFSVRVRAESLEVVEEDEEVLSRDFLPALAVTLVAETLAAGLITLSLRPARLYTFLIPLASLISLPVAWVVFPAIGLYDFLTVILAEVFVVWFEAVALRLLTRRAITIELALAYSVVINLASFVVGLFVI